jgi:DNA-binding NtrC family response regulator
VGASTSLKVDVRIIAATNADLDSRIAGGSFRQDLYFRLARYTVATPRLRDRLQDVPLLTSHFLQRFAAEMGIKAPPVSGEAIRALEAYEFPGNVREFKNIMERALIESGGSLILPEHLRLLRGSCPTAVPSNSGAKTELASSLPLKLADAEEILIQRALKETNGNIADAARLLGVHRTRIYRKLAQENAA